MQKFSTQVISRISMGLILLLTACASQTPQVTPTPSVSPTATETIPPSPTPIPSAATTSTPTIPVIPNPGDDLGFIKGMNYVGWNLSSFDTPNIFGIPASDQSLELLSLTGTNWVAIPVQLAQETYQSTDIFNTFEATTTDEALVHAIQTAHRLGMKVMLKMMVFSKDELAHGEMGNGLSPQEWDKWFASYTTMVTRYAKIAQDNGVEMFCVGTELHRPQEQTSHFRKLIEALRAVYRGPVTYSANHPTLDLEWWDAVDYIGVDAYFPLSNKAEPSVEDLELKWAPISKKLEALQKRWNKPLIFTEIGYSSLKYPTAFDASSNEMDPQAQANAYQAVFNVFMDQPWFHGMFWWEWEPTPYQGSTCDPTASPFDKPAENILRENYGAPLKQLEADVKFPQLLSNEINEFTLFTDNFAPNITPAYSMNGPYQVSDEQAFSGNKSLKVELASSNNLNIAYDNRTVNGSSYQWLEFYIYTTVPIDKLNISMSDSNNTWHGFRPLTRCDYFEGGKVNLGGWTHVLLPLAQLNADNSEIQNTFFYLVSGEPLAMTIWLDDVRLVGLK